MAQDPQDRTRVMTVVERIAQLVRRQDRLEGELFDLRAEIEQSRVIHDETHRIMDCKIENRMSAEYEKVIRGKR